MLYGHGDNGYLYGQELIADFSSNVWYGGEPAGLKQHIFQQWQCINKYPEVLAESLTEKVSRHHNLPPENILINNGTTESIYLIAQAFKDKRTGIVIPSFAEYEDACRMFQHLIHFIPWQELEQNIPHHPAWLNTDLLWLGNPNNPTGDVLPALETLVRHHPQTIFVVDEAFIEFTNTIASSIHLIQQLPNLVIQRSLTKAFAIPGLRLGYIAASKEVISRLRALKLPWSVNALALEAGNFIFDHYDTIKLPLTRLLQDRTEFSRQLQETGIRTYPSHTHFFLCETDSGDASGLQKFLLNKFRLLIRNAGNFRGLSAQHFRLATLTPDKNQWLINAIKEW